MANQHHLGVLEGGVYRWNNWRDEHPEAVPDLREAYLREADLSGFNLRGANLRGAMLMGANFSGADLREANLSRADLRFVEIGNARLTGAQLDKAKGAPPEMLRKAQRPGGLRSLFSSSTVPVLAGVMFGAAAALTVENLPSILPPGPEVNAAERPAAGNDLPELGPPSNTSAHYEPALPREPKASPLRRTPTPAAPPARDVVSLLEEVRFPGWSVVSGQLSGSVLTLRLDVPEVEEQTYLPTLAAVCGAMWGRPELGRINEIRIVNSDGLEGWAYDRPRNCPALIQAPKNMLRLAAGADSLRWTANP